MYIKLAFYPRNYKFLAKANKKTQVKFSLIHFIVVFFNCFFNVFNMNFSRKMENTLDLWFKSL